MKKYMYLFFLFSLFLGACSPVVPSLEMIQFDESMEAKSEGSKESSESKKREKISENIQDIGSSDELSEDATSDSGSSTTDSSEDVSFEESGNEFLRNEERDREEVADEGKNPSLSSLSPGQGMEKTFVSVTIKGSNFEKDAEVYLGGKKQQVSFTNANELVSNFDLQGVSPGTYKVFVQNPGGVKTETFEFTVLGAPDEEPKPYITSMNPSTWEDACDVNVTIQGKNFLTLSKLHVGSSIFAVGSTTHPLVFHDKTKLSLTLKSNQFQAGSKLDVKVENSTTSLSNTVQLSITSTYAEKLSIFRLSPQQAPQGSSLTLNVTVPMKSVLPENLVVFFDGVALETTCQLSRGRCYGRLEAKLALGSASVGNHKITVGTPCGKKSDSVEFTILAPRNPQVVGFSPSHALVGSKHKIIVKGQDFLKNTVIIWNGQKTVTTWISDKEIQTTNAIDFSASSPGNIEFYVESPGSIQSNRMKFSILAATNGLSISSTNPNTFENGKVHQHVSIQGQGFSSGTEFFLNDVKITSSFVSVNEVILPSLDFRNTQYGPQALYAQHGMVKSNTVYLTAQAKSFPLLHKVYPSEFIEGAGTRSFSLYAENYCEVQSRKCATSPKVIIKDASGTDHSAKFQLPSYFGYSTIRGALDITDLPPGSYTIQIARSSGEKSLPVRFNILKSPTPEIQYTNQAIFQTGDKLTFGIRGKYFCASNGSSCVELPIVTLQSIDKKDYSTHFILDTNKASSTSLSGSLDLSGVPVGDYEVIVENSKSKEKSQAYPLFVRPLPPAYISGQSVHILEKNKKYQVELHGGNFSPTTSVFIGSTKLQTSFVDNKKIIIDLDTNVLTEGSHKLELKSPQSTLSSPFYISVIAGTTPNIGSIKWNKEDAPFVDQSHYRVTVYGNELKSTTGDTKIKLNGNDIHAQVKCSGTGVNSYCLIYNFEGKKEGLVEGENKLSCLRADGSTCPDFTFWVRKVPAPVLKNVSMAVLPLNSTASFSIRGSYFASGATAVLGSISYPITIKTTSSYVKIDTTGFTKGKHRFVIKNPDGRETQPIHLTIR